MSLLMIGAHPWPLVSDTQDAHSPHLRRRQKEGRPFLVQRVEMHARQQPQLGDHAPRERCELWGWGV